VRWLLKLYPPAWRRRYETELAALLEEQRAGTRDILDLIRGAGDAWAIGPRGPLGGLTVWLAAFAFALATIAAAVVHRALGPLPQPAGSLFDAVYWIVFIVLIWWVGQQPAAKCDLSRLTSRLHR
jgi:hypothetical protein